MASDTLTAPTIAGTATRPKVYKNFIDGEWVESSTGETFENRNPADTRDVVGMFQNRPSLMSMQPSMPQNVLSPSGVWFRLPAGLRLSTRPPKCCWNAKKTIRAT